MTGKFSFLYIVVSIVVCMSVIVAFSGVVFAEKVNAAAEPETILVSGDNDSDDRPPRWEKKDKKGKKGKKDRGTDDESSDDSSSDDSSSDDSSSDDKPSPHKPHPPHPPHPNK